MCFNPRPPLLAGESPSGGRRTGSRPSFNPRPPLLAGESLTTKPNAKPTSRFNPRPPLLAGESAHGHDLALQAAVSIRARHCWRANPPKWPPCCTTHTFQSAPAIAGGRIAAWLCVSLVPEMFQSAPAIAGGRICLTGWRFTGTRSFNPRPPLLAGESPPQPCRA